MSNISKTYHSKVYRDFKEIREDSFRTVIVFYERYLPDISSLEFPEQFELLVDYADALFESGAYQKHLIASREIIRNSIYNNIQYHKERGHLSGYSVPASCILLPIVPIFKRQAYIEGAYKNVS